MGLDPLITTLRARIRRVDAEILTAVRQQAASGGCSRRGPRPAPPGRMRLGQRPELPHKSLLMVIDQALKHTLHAHCNDWVRTEAAAHPVSVCFIFRPPRPWSLSLR